MDPEKNENGQPVPPKVVLPKQATQPPQGAPGAPKNLQTMHIELPEGEQSAPPAPPVPPPAQRPIPTAVRPTVVVKPMPVAPLPAGERHQTVQINSDDLNESAPEPAPAQPPGQALGPTVYAKPSPTVSVKALGLPVVPGAPTAKRETSRIPLELAKPSLGAPGRPVPGPSTIRVKPVVIRQTVDLAQAVPDGAAPAAPVLPPVSPESGKRKTSRISLESVLSGQGVASQTAEIAPPEVDEEPRTIRIKRSAERPTARAAAAPAAAPISPGQTARLELPAETPAVAPGEAVSQTPTRKKTIKVKRPGAEDGDEEGAAVGAVARPEPAARATEDVPHATFGVFAVLAVLVVAVLIWVLMAQTFGRDLSLTQLSYGWPDCDLPWPNKIPIIRQ